MGRKIYSKYLRKRKWYLCLLIFLIGAGTALNGFPPYIFGVIVDILTGISHVDFEKTLLIYIGILLSVEILSSLETLFGQWITSSLENDAKEDIVNHAIHMKSKDADRYQKGQLLNHLEADVETIIGYYIDFISSILMILVNLGIALFFLFHISSSLSLIAIIFFPLSYLVNYGFRNKIRQVEKTQKEINDDYFEYVNRIFEELKSIKAFSIQEIIKRKFKNFFNQKLHIEMKSASLSMGISVIHIALNNLLNVVLLAVAGWMIFEGRMTVGSLVAFNSYLDKLFEAISKILELNFNRQGVYISFQRLEALEKKELEEEQDGGIILNTPVHQLQFKDVEFSYDERVVLNKINFLIKQNGLYSFVGKNGCGKTTILKLVERFYDIDKGSLEINQLAIQEYKTASLRHEIAYMSKEAFFLEDTIYNNLRIGNELISDEEIEEACHKVGIHRDIMNMEKQYKTILQHGGENLSSGQRQKLGFARLMLKRASVYLLDEITSDLDGAAEKQICRLMEELAENAIILNISHKEECLKRSSHIFVIDKGRIIAEGSHDKLLKNCLVYCQFYSQE